MKIANIDREIFDILWTIWGISVKSAGKIFPMIILKVTRNQGFFLSLENTFFEKPQRGCQTDPPPPPFPPAVLGLMMYNL